MPGNGRPEEQPQHLAADVPYRRQVVTLSGAARRLGLAKRPVDARYRGRADAATLLVLLDLAPPAAASESAWLPDPVVWGVVVCADSGVQSCLLGYRRGPSLRIWPVSMSRRMTRYRPVASMPSRWAIPATVMPGCAVTNSSICPRRCPGAAAGRRRTARRVAPVDFADGTARLGDRPARSADADAGTRLLEFDRGVARAPRRRRLGACWSLSLPPGRGSYLTPSRPAAVRNCSYSRTSGSSSRRRPTTWRSRSRS